MRIAQRTRRAVGWNDADIRQIDEAGNDILIVHRSLPADFSQLAADAKVGEVRFKTTARGAAGKISRGLSHLDLTLPGRHRALLAEDIFGLVCGMLVTFGWPRVEVRLDVADVQSCPKFHCDNVSVRLVTTYTGPGTEYVARSSSKAVHRAAAGALVFLKGGRHPTHGDRILHRSPELRPGNRRLTVAIDFANWLDHARDDETPPLLAPGLAPWAS
jgi:hypothetical protein